MQSLSRVQLFSAPWTIARQASLSMEFSRQEYWSGLPFPTSGDLPDPGIEPASLVSPALAGGFFTTSTTWEAPYSISGAQQPAESEEPMWSELTLRWRLNLRTSCQLSPDGIHCELCIKQPAQQCSSVCRASVGVSVKPKDDLMTRQTNDWMTTLQGE